MIRKIKHTYFFTLGYWLWSLVFWVVCMIKLQNLFSSEDLCTCTWNLDEDSCKGDSGGPLFLSENDRFVACWYVEL